MELDKQDGIEVTNGFKTRAAGYFTELCWINKWWRCIHVSWLRFGCTQIFYSWSRRCWPARAILKVSCPWIQGSWNQMQKLISSSLINKALIFLKDILLVDLKEFPSVFQKMQHSNARHQKSTSNLLRIKLKGILMLNKIWPQDGAMYITLW